MGLLSILIVLFLTVQGFYTFMNNMIVQKNNYVYLNWMYKINIEIS